MIKKLREYLQTLQLGSLDKRFDVLDRESQIKYLRCNTKDKTKIRKLLWEERKGEMEISKVQEKIDKYYKRRVRW